MALSLVNQVYTRQFSAREREVLLVLADGADEQTHLSSFSKRFIAWKIDRSTRFIQGVLSDLKDCEIIEEVPKAERPKELQSRTWNVYRLHLSRREKKLPFGYDKRVSGENDVLGGGEQRSPGGSRIFSPGEQDILPPSKDVRKDSKKDVHKPLVETPQERRFQGGDWQYQIANEYGIALLGVGLLDEPPSDKVLDDWADVLDRLVRLDGYSKLDIRLVGQWLFAPGNWWIETANFRTPLKFRRKNPDKVKYFDVFLRKAKLEYGHYHRNRTERLVAETTRLTEDRIKNAPSLY